jgi:hypothetical protein
MSIFAALAIAAQIQAPDPVLWLAPNGQIMVQGQAVQPTFSPGTRAIKTSRGVVYDFDGRRSGILLPDVRPLQLTESMTVSTWIYLRSYVNDGPGAQILFRGDDRCGLDPYTLNIMGDGTVRFAVQNAQDRGFIVQSEIPLQQWVHVLASWDMPTGRLALWLNGENVAMAKTTVQPFGPLDKGWSPGIGIGNVQNEKGPHNQPIKGQISDLRVYRGVWTPDDLLTRKPEIPPQ